MSAKGKEHNTFVTQQKLSVAAGCQRSTIQRYGDLGIFDELEPSASGQYRLLDALKAIIEHLRESAAGRVGESSDGEIIDLATASAKLKIAQTDKTRQEEKLKRIAVERILGNLISRDDVGKSMALIISSARAKLQAFGNRIGVIAPALTEKELLAIRSELREMLQALADELPATVEKEIDRAVEEARSS